MDGSFKQKFPDGSLVPKKYYCNVYCTTDSDGIIIADFNTHPDELIGHHKGCAFVRNYSAISLALLCNCYVSMNDDCEVIPKIRECNCIKENSPLQKNCIVSLFNKLGKLMFKGTIE